MSSPLPRRSLRFSAILIHTCAITVRYLHAAFQIKTATRRAWKLTLLLPEPTSAQEIRSKLARQVLYVRHGHCIFVDQCELESDSRSDVTSNDVSVK